MVFFSSHEDSSRLDKDSARFVPVNVGCRLRLERWVLAALHVQSLPPFVLRCFLGLICEDLSMVVVFFGPLPLRLALPCGSVWRHESSLDPLSNIAST